jgi:transcriptional regulator with XRE-family HTH domain
MIKEIILLVLKVANRWQCFCNRLKQIDMCSKKTLFSEKIRQLREEKKLYQKQLADALSIDKPMYCRIEKGERRAKKEQIPIIAEILQADSEELLTLWLADQVNAVVEDEHKAGGKALDIAKENLIK